MILHSLKKVIDYIRLAALMFGMLVGVQIPSFVEQYGKSLESRYLESQQSIAGFQEDAKRYFSGDLDKLIAHYASQDDPVIQSGGYSIRDVMNRREKLQGSVKRFNETWISPYFETFVNPHYEIREAVWASYTHTIVLKEEAIVFAVCSGLLGVSLIDFVFGLLGVGGRMLMPGQKKSQPVSKRKVKVKASA